MEKSVTNEVFLLWEWIYVWWNSFKDGDKELYILVGEDSRGKMAGIAPFYKEDKAVISMTGRRILRFCSSSDMYPDHLDNICEKEYADSFLESICGYLKKIKRIGQLLNWTGWREFLCEGIFRTQTGRYKRVSC